MPGANVNQDLDPMNFAERQAVSATWVRGFYLMQNVDHSDVATQPQMQKLTNTVSQGYGTVLNLKFEYPEGFRAPDSSAIDVAIQRLAEVLAVRFKPHKRPEPTTSGRPNRCRPRVRPPPPPPPPSWQPPSRRAGASTPRSRCRWSRASPPVRTPPPRTRPAATSNRTDRRRPWR